MDRMASPAAQSHRRAGHLAARAMIVAALTLGADAAFAQAVTTTSTELPGADAIKQREQELEAARMQARLADEAQKKLQAEIAAIGQDRNKLNQQLIDTAASVRGVETRIADTADAGAGSARRGRRAAGGAPGFRRPCGGRGGARRRRCWCGRRTR